MSSSSESEDDKILQLKSSVDPEFYYDSRTSGSKIISKKVPPISTRLNKFADDSTTDLDTTPEFRNHVAKRLSKIIDRQIKVISRKQTADEKMTTENMGVRLFSSCKNFATVEIEDVPLKKKPKKKKVILENSSEDSSNDDTDMLSSVAVSSDWVLKGRSPYQIVSNTPIIETHKTKICNDEQNLNTDRNYKKKKKPKLSR